MKCNLKKESKGLGQDREEGTANIEEKFSIYITFGVNDMIRL